MKIEWYGRDIYSVRYPALQTSLHVHAGSLGTRKDVSGAMDKMAGVPDICALQMGFSEILSGFLLI